MGIYPHVVLPARAGAAQAFSRDSVRTIHMQNDDLEPTEPGKVPGLYLKYKSTDCRESTVQSHSDRTSQFIRCGEETKKKNRNTISVGIFRRFASGGKKTGTWHESRKISKAISILKKRSQPLPVRTQVEIPTLTFQVSSDPSGSVHRISVVPASVCTDPLWPLQYGKKAPSSPICVSSPTPIWPLDRGIVARSASTSRRPLSTTYSETVSALKSCAGEYTPRLGPPLGSKTPVLIRRTVTASSGSIPLHSHTCEELDPSGVLGNRNSARRCSEVIPD